MSRVETTAAMDRLPWLPDEPQPQAAKHRRGSVLGWATALLIATAAGGLWIGPRTLPSEHVQPIPRVVPSTTIRLPEARPAEPAKLRIATEPQVKAAPAPEVRPAPAHEVRIALPPVARSATKVSGPAEAPIEPGKPAVTAVVAPAQPPIALPKPWNPRIAAGASGRLVQIGAFGSTLQAKRGWWFMVRAYPAVAHLPAVVRPARNSKGRVFYRFQIGTTSQAHSEVLCQRMQRIQLSCAVVGLPWKAKVER